MSEHKSYHVTFSPPGPDEKNWPNGFWAVYAINGDQIAQRIIFDTTGKVTVRHSWPGFLGGAGSLDEIRDLIVADRMA